MHRFLKQCFLRSIQHFSCRYLPERSCSSSNRGGVVCSIHAQASLFEALFIYGTYGWKVTVSHRACQTDDAVQIRLTGFRNMTKIINFYRSQVYCNPQLIILIIYDRSVPQLSAIIFVFFVFPCFMALFKLQFTLQNIHFPYQH